MAIHSLDSMPDKRAASSMERPAFLRAAQMQLPNKRPQTARRSSGRWEDGRGGNFLFSVLKKVLLQKGRPVRQAGPCGWIELHDEYVLMPHTFQSSRPST